MAQCVKYPNECEGSVKRDEIDEKWYCHKHRNELEHLRETGRRPSLEDHVARKLSHIEEGRLARERREENQDRGNN